MVRKDMRRQKRKEGKWWQNKGKLLTPQPYLPVKKEGSGFSGMAATAFPGMALAKILKSWQRERHEI